MKLIQQIASFIRLHRWFTLFVLIMFSFNIYQLSRYRPEVDKRLSCSTYDKGIWGSFAFYETMEKSGVPVRRTQNLSFFTLKPKTDRGKTLVMLNPQITLSTWEWEYILSWTAKGNRVITSGFYGLGDEEMYNARHSLKKTAKERITVLYGDTSYTLPLVPMISMNNTFELDAQSADSIILKDISYKRTNSAPFLLIRDTVSIGVRRIVGKGEWTVLGVFNPMSNSLLSEQSSWFRFSSDLLLGDTAYSREIIFDEYHNGFQATQSLNQLLSFYQFDDGLELLAVITLLYLFFTGIRILPPASKSRINTVDTISGLRTMGSFFYRCGGWTELLKAEMNLIFQRVVPHKSPETITAEEFLDYFMRRHSVSQLNLTESELLKNIEDIISNNINRKNGLNLYRTILSLRKVCER